MNNSEAVIARAEAVGVPADASPAPFRLAALERRTLAM